MTMPRVCVEHYSEQITAPPDQATPLHVREVIQGEVEGDRDNSVPMRTQFESTIGHIDRAEAAHALSTVEEK
jgi:hypothetical protein